METYCLRDNEGDWWVSEDGESFTLTDIFEGSGFLTIGSAPLVNIERHAGGIDAGALPADLYWRLTAPDNDADGYAWPALARGSTIAHDAHEAVYGRADAYGHPRENLTRTAHLWTALLSPLLADGEYVTPEDVARCMVAVKLSRDVSHPKRDNRTDIAGYAIALDRLATGQ